MKDRVGHDLCGYNWHAVFLAPDSRAIVEPLGEDHAAIRAEAGRVLLVSFERACDIHNAGLDGQPLAATLAEPAGWSRLTLVARSETWFRDPAVYAYFDRLIDAGYFDRFDRVVFYGAGMCGYAAAAFSVAAPGAAVLALSPQATLDPCLASWDGRFAAARRRDFASRYGFAPHMVEAAEQVMVVYDPACREDAMHAALFHGSNVTRLRTPHCGQGLDFHLMAMGVLPELIDAAGEGALTAEVFHRLFRARRGYGPYLRALMDRIEANDRPALGARLCRHVLRRRNHPQFARRLAEFESRVTIRREAMRGAAPTQRMPAAALPPYDAPSAAQM
ncbi:hypothetical protein SAMN05444722_0277 [Rhodovulum sp. ES.010]|uniref:hypothetical protein n=1 Tax=Rhodovulum sp. ES.010 TaxID=1882821 RepID=UPI00092AED0F|nr:hypothetical protein [Rhodovulum sp. ES.010]SIO06160.1 hypothetical protein SAMN05444722_0277 [Rhodovulum sp. ES.010]